MTEPKVAPPPPARAGNEGHASSPRDAIRQAHSINRAAVEAVRGLLQTPVASPECSEVPGWPGRLGVALAEECLSLELVHRCLAQQSAALDDPALSGLTGSVQALERTLLTLREVGRKKLMLATLAESGEAKSGVPRCSREDSLPIKVLSDAVRREALSLVRKLGDQQGMLDRAIETREALVQQVFLG
jgi:hypothetical protein